MVNIRISVRSVYPDSDSRSHELYACLKNMGFSFERGEAVSHEGEAAAVKQKLRGHGFADKDFQINVQYQRGWGFL